MPARPRLAPRAPSHAHTAHLPGTGPSTSGLSVGVLGSGLQSSSPTVPDSSPSLPPPTGDRGQEAELSGLIYKMGVMAPPQVVCSQGSSQPCV